LPQFASASFDSALLAGPFPRRDNSQTVSAVELLSQWIVTAEAKAELAKLEGGTCHPYGRIMEVLANCSKNDQAPPRREPRLF
jgi:hypothetical protein